MIYSERDPRVECNYEAFLPLNTLNHVMVYAHGELEVLYGFDIIVTDYIPLYNNIVGASYIKPQIVPTLATDFSEQIYFINIYVWRPSEFSPEVRGLAVLKDDEVANRDALEKLEQRVAHL